MLIPLICYSY